MEKIYSKIEKPLMKIADVIGSILFFQVLQDAFMLALPIIVSGSFIIIIANFPFLNLIIGEEPALWWKELLSPVGNATINAMSIFVCIGIGYNFAKRKKCDGQYCAAICVCVFFILMPWYAGTLFENDADGNVTQNLITVFTSAVGGDKFGAKGMFVGMLASFGASFLFCFFTNKNWQIKMPEQVPPTVSRSFASLIPAALTIIIAVIVRTLFTFTPWGSAFEFIYEFIQTPLLNLGSGFGATIVAVIAMQVFWFFGLHGTLLINSIMDTIWNGLMLENAQAFAIGADLPNIVTKPFMEVFYVGIGGSGLTIAAVIFLVTRARSKQLRQLGKVAFPPGLFNVNEPFTFGLPIIFNPLTIIPWIIAPLIAVTIAYFATDWGLVPRTIGVNVPWTTPMILSGFIATNSWQGAVLQVVEAVVVGAIWYPFLKIMDRRLYNAEGLQKQES